MRGRLVSGIGSLDQSRLRLAGAAEVLELDGALEVLTLANSVAVNGSHLLSEPGRCPGMRAGRTPGLRLPRAYHRRGAAGAAARLDFRREPDAATGYEELAPRRREGSPG
jgi:hypothetical protein